MVSRKRSHATAMESGLDRDELLRFRRALHTETMELSSLAGASHVVLRNGSQVYACADGWADKEKRRHFSLKTLCALHGATKPLLAAAFLTLVDAGKCKLSDPVSRFIPFAAATKGWQPTLENLLTMTAGLGGYDNCAQYRPLMRRVRAHKIADLESFVAAIAEQPLLRRPGTRCEYGFCYDVLGRVCEIISGKRLDKFMEERLLHPLGMKDTHFVLPKRKQDRAARLYEAKRKGRASKAKFQLIPYRDRHSAPGIMSGGGGITSYHDAGMWSTALDYARFCQMLLDGGRAQSGQQVLRPGMAQRLWRDALVPFGRRRDGRLDGWHNSDGKFEQGGWWDSKGLSLLHSFLDLDGTPGVGKSRRTSSMWMSGGGGAFWTIDAKTKIVTVSMTQTFGGRADNSDGHGPLSYRIVDHVNVSKGSLRQTGRKRVRIGA